MALQGCGDVTAEPTADQQNAKGGGRRLAHAHSLHPASSPSPHRGRGSPYVTSWPHLSSILPLVCVCARPRVFF